MSRSVIIHHGSCFDGVAGAWVAHRALSEEGAKDIMIFPAHYGDPPPDVRGANVIIVDFSYKRDVLSEIADRANSLTVIDHHKTAEADLKGFSRGNIFFDMERSGAGLAWDILFPKLQRPWFIDNIEDRDLWRFKVPMTKYIIAFLAASELSISTFQQLMGMTRSEVAQKGMSIQDYIDTYGQKASEHWTIKNIAGYDIPVINVPYMNSSDHVDTLMEKLPGHPFYAYFFMRSGGAWQFGLRSSGDFDVSAIAQRYGGGGHKNASGFTCQYLPWDPAGHLIHGDVSVIGRNN